MHKFLRKTLTDSNRLHKFLFVSRKEKQLAKLKNHKSDNNWTLNEVLTLLGNHGFIKTGDAGSHQVFISPEFDAPIVLAPHGEKIKSGYIRKIRETLIKE